MIWRFSFKLLLKTASLPVITGQIYHTQPLEATGNLHVKYKVQNNAPL